MDMPTLAKVSNLKREDVNLKRLYLGYIVFIVGTILSGLTNWLNMIIVIILFSYLMITAVDWSIK